MYLYEIDGKYYNELEVISYFKLKGYTRNLEHLRKQGILCHRKELDFQPIIQGYKKTHVQWQRQGRQYNNKV